jgi:hypothetical protein
MGVLMKSTLSQEASTNSSVLDSVPILVELNIILAITQRSVTARERANQLRRSLVKFRPFICNCQSWSCNNLKDAILTTRELGLQFLWIDSLCMIQDSEDEEIKKLSMMMQFLQAYALTLAHHLYSFSKASNSARAQSLAFASGSTTYLIDGWILLPS